MNKEEQELETQEGRCIESRELIAKGLVFTIYSYSQRTEDDSKVYFDIMIRTEGMFTWDPFIKWTTCSRAVMKQLEQTTLPIVVQLVVRNSEVGRKYHILKEGKYCEVKKERESANRGMD